MSSFKRIVFRIDLCDTLDPRTILASLTWFSTVENSFWIAASCDCTWTLQLCHSVIKMSQNILFA